MMKIIGLLYFADIYAGIICALCILMGCLVIGIIIAAVNTESFGNSDEHIKTAKRWVIGQSLVLLFLLAITTLMPSEKFVQRACYIGVGLELTHIVMEQVPDSVKTQAKDNVVNAAMQGMELPSNALGLLNGWTKSKLKELEAEVLPKETIKAEK